MTALQGGACGITSAHSDWAKLPPSKNIVMPGLVPGIHVFFGQRE
jgi:hypothetical protein